MNLGTARTQLRFMLGDQSESVWSDSNLTAILDRSNLRMFRRIAQEDASAPINLKYWKYPKDATGIFLTGGSSSDYTTTGTDLNQIISLEALLWKTYAGGETDGSYNSLPLGTMAEFAENDYKAGGNSPLYDLVSIYPQAAGGFKAYLGGGKVMLSIRPTPSLDLMIKGLVTLDTSETELQDGDDTTLLLQGFYTALHEAVLYDAGYLASFKDESLRQEFFQMREDVMSISTTGNLIAKEAY